MISNANQSEITSILYSSYNDGRTPKTLRKQTKRIKQRNNPLSAFISSRSSRRIRRVGSWAAEALVRSGIGKIKLIDLDDICISNTNRQLHAMSSTVGKMKIEEMKR